MATQNQKMIYVGIGCGALVLVGMCAVGGIGAYVMLSGEDATAASLSPGRPQHDRARPAAPEGFRSIEGDRWSFAVPAHWADLDLPPPVVIAVRETKDGFQTNVNLVTEPFTGDGTSYGRANMAMLRQHVTVVAERPAGGAAPGLEVEAEWPDNAPPTHTLQRFAATGGNGYVLTCTGPLGGFEDVRATCDRILGTFYVDP